MNSTILKDKQKLAFSNLVNRDLPELLRSNSYVKDNKYEVDFELYPLNLDNPTEESGTIFVTIKAKCTIKNRETKETQELIIDLQHLPVYQELGFMISGNNMQILDMYEKTPGWSFLKKAVKASPGEQVITANLLGVNRKKCAFKYDNKKAACFTVNRNKDKGEDDDNVVEISVSSLFRAITDMSNEDLLGLFGYENSFNVIAFSENGKALLETNANGKNTMHIHNKNDCIEALALAIFGKKECAHFATLAAKQRAVNNWLFNKKYYDLGSGNLKRLDNTQSFKNRAINKILARPITVNGEYVPDGFILTESLLEKIDRSPIDKIYVNFNGKVHTLQKFSTFTFRALGFKLAKEVTTSTGVLAAGTILDAGMLDDLNDSDLTEIVVFADNNATNKRNIVMTRRTDASSLHIDDLLTAYSIFANNLNGFDVFDKPYELSNRIVVPFDKKMCSIVQKNLDSVVETLNKGLGLLSYSTVNVVDNDAERSEEVIDYEGEISADRNIINAISDFCANYRLEEFIVAIKNAESAEGQMSDMNNIMSVVSKSFKITSNISSKSITDDLICVQDTQSGRLDSFDAPESSKIGVVHHRTILSRTDGDGYLTAPYFRVKNGVVEDTPVYITATEELDKYIAEWNETFVDESGAPKERLVTKHNGDIVTTDVANVTLKEYSQLQTMSPARSCIPFQENSNGKRLLMACNHQKQAVPTVKAERAFVGTGGESLLNIGCYRAIDLVEEYFNATVLVHPELQEHAVRIKSGNLELVDITSGKGTRSFTFLVAVVDELVKSEITTADPYTVVSVPYLQKNSEKNMFSYRINSNLNNSFSGSDVVIYNTGYDIKEYNMELLVDYGGMKVERDNFKSGTALGMNFNIAFKTFAGSTIDDAITISSDLVYDDRLTTITMVSKEEELYNTDTKIESFGAPLCDGIPTYFDTNGLPKLGTILKPGDAAICKLIKEDGKGARPKMSCLNSYTEGQVVYAAIKTRNNKECAEVILATRSSAEVGDKLSGRCGNKGVIARVVPVEQMPYNPATGEIVDICLNPQGVPSRMNISQLLEIVLGMAMKRKNSIAIVSPFQEHSLDFVREMAESENVHPAMLRDGRTGQFFERPVNMGVMYMQKLVHMVKKKIHSIGFEYGLDAVTLQPKKGAKNEGGQSFSEMETWCLQGIGADCVLQEIQSTLSDDVLNRGKVKEELSENPYDFDIVGNNRNDLMLQAMYRSMGAEIVTKTDETGTAFYEFKPLLDKEIKSLANKPVIDEKALHDTSIFGKTDTVEDKAVSKSKWGWINLKTEMISPLWIEKGSLHKLMYSRDKKSYKPCLDGLFKGLLEQKTYVLRVDGPLLYLTLQPATQLSKLDPELSANYITGFEALFYVLKNYDVSSSLQITKDKLKTYTDAKVNKNSKSAYEYDKDAYWKLIHSQRIIEDFISRGAKLSDYIITAYPVAPQTFRPLIKTPGLHATPDFDWHYTQIINAVRALDIQKSEVSLRLLYNAIRSFIGTGSGNSQGSKNKKKKYQSLANWFLGTDKEKDHGKLRVAVQSKKVCRSGRSAIVPAEDTTMLPTQLGVPISMIVKMYETQLIAHLSSKLQVPGTINVNNWRTLFDAIATKNTGKYKAVYAKHFESLFEMRAGVAKTHFIDWIKEFVSGSDGKPVGPDGRIIYPQVVLAGRQPSLHQFSIRAVFPVVVFTKAINIHPLVCKGYNADFDGDTMWLIALLGKAAQEEAIQLMSPKNNIVNPKNSSIVLEHAQDIALGVYCATMLKNNTERIQEFPEIVDDIRHYGSISQLQLDLDAGIVHAYNLICYNNGVDKFLSTAGRIIFNSLLPEGFTAVTEEGLRKPFSNTLGLEGIKTERFRELQYDGLITSGGSKSDVLRSYKLQNICADLHERFGEFTLEEDSTKSCIGAFQAISEFGFKYSDRFSVTLSIEDLEDVSKRTHKNDIIKDADATKALIEQDFQAGLICAEDKKKAILKLYNKANKEIETDMIDNMQRNNNIFIMFDSGARGSKGQILQTCGVIGTLQKTKTEDLENSITSNYYEGISSFDLHSTSYSTRTGVASTQNETRSAGYGTRKAVHMTCGLKIVEKDCGKKDWWFDILWGNRKENLDRLYPSEDFFNRNLLGKSVWPTDLDTMKLFGDTLNGGQITESSSGKLANGFHSIVLTGDARSYKMPADNNYVFFKKNLLGSAVLNEDAKVLLGGTLQHGLITKNSHRALDGYTGEIIVSSPKNLTVSPDTAIGARLVNDVVGERELKYFLENGRVSGYCMKVVDKKFLKSLNTSYGRFEFRYGMTQACSSLLQCREARNLPFLKRVKNKTDNSTLDVITSKTIAHIEREGLNRVEVRILLDCETGRDESKHGDSEHGCCAHCYGLKYTNHQLPVVGEIVGVEAAQAVGEPAAQLTMSLFHKGGAAGESVASGVETFNSLLQGTVPNKNRSALIADNSGYIGIERLDNTAVLSIMPANRDSELCIQCKRNLSATCEECRMRKQDNCSMCDKNPVLICPMDVDGSSGECLLKKRVSVPRILCRSGEWINAGDAITDGYVSPNDIKNVGESNSTAELVRKKQMTWLLNYFDTFASNNIYINARHFEIFSRLQNFNMIVVESDNPAYLVGRSYEYSELSRASGTIKAIMNTTKREDVIISNSGALTILSFENVPTSLARLVMEGHRSYRNAPIGAINVGENLITGEKRVLDSPASLYRDNGSTNGDVLDFSKSSVKFAADVATNSPVINLGSLDLNSIFSDSPKEVSAVVDSTVNHAALDQETYEPVAGVVFDLIDSQTGVTVKSVDTNDAGNAVFFGVKPGEYVVRVVDTPRDYEHVEYEKSFSIKGNKVMNDIGMMLLAKVDPLAQSAKGLQSMSAFEDVHCENVEDAEPDVIDTVSYNNTLDYEYNYDLDDEDSTGADLEELTSKVAPAEPTKVVTPSNMNLF